MTRRLSYTTKTPGRNGERGSVLVAVTIAISVVLASAAVAVDLTHMHQAHTSLQAAADSAALAAVSGLKVSIAQARSRAARFARKNRADGNRVWLDEEDDVEFGNWDRDARTFTVATRANLNRSDAVRVTTRMSSERGSAVQLSMMRLFGVSTGDVAASAVATLGGATSWDVMLVQDVSGSFRQEIGQAKIADHVLLDCINDHAAPESLFGVITHRGDAWLKGAVGAVGTDYAAHSNEIRKIKVCGSGKCDGGTNASSGMNMALDILDKTPKSTMRAGRAIVVFSDGEPNCMEPTKCTSNSQIAGWDVAAADLAAARDISVYAVFYSGNRGMQQKGSDHMRSLVRGDGIFVDEPDKDQLDDALWKVCLAMAPRLVR